MKSLDAATVGLINKDFTSMTTNRVHVAVLVVHTVPGQAYAVAAKINAILQTKPEMRIHGQQCKPVTLRGGSRLGEPLARPRVFWLLLLVCRRPS